jgi:hypothetical protein
VTIIGQPRVSTVEKLIQKVDKLLNKIMERQFNEICLDELTPQQRLGYKKNISFLQALQRKSRTIEELAAQPIS